MDYRVFFGRFLPDGTPIGESFELIERIDLTYKDEIPFVWTGSEYAVVWDEVLNILFTRVGCLP